MVGVGLSRKWIGVCIVSLLVGWLTPNQIVAAEGGGVGCSDVFDRLDRLVGSRVASALRDVLARLRDQVKPEEFKRVEDAIAALPERKPLRWWNSRLGSEQYFISRLINALKLIASSPSDVILGKVLTVPESRLKRDELDAALILAQGDVAELRTYATLDWATDVFKGPAVRWMEWLDARGRVDFEAGISPMVRKWFLSSPPQNVLGALNSSISYLDGQVRNGNAGARSKLRVLLKVREGILKKGETSGEELQAVQQRIQELDANAPWRSWFARNLVTRGAAKKVDGILAGLVAYGALFLYLHAMVEPEGPRRAPVEIRALDLPRPPKSELDGQILEAEQILKKINEAEQRVTVEGSK